jgi:DNA-binding CsgD family transcriptional regulator
MKEYANLARVLPTTETASERERISIAHGRAHETSNAQEIWEEMLCGHWAVKDHFVDGQRAYAVLYRRTPVEARAQCIDARRLAILRRTMSGESQKSIAIDLGVGDSSVATILADCRRRLGVTCRGSALPLIVVLIAQAVWTPFEAELWVSPGETSDGTELVVSIQRPDIERIEGLTLAEANVASRLVEGRSQREIALLRNARPRTIVNQMATVRRKLRISGRIELVRFLATRTRPG